MVTRTRLDIDVSTAAPPGARRVAVEIVAPEPGRLADPPVAVSCLPGGGMTRRYFDLQVDPAYAAVHGGYSMAEHLAEAGLVVVLVDHPAVGDSDVPDDPYLLTPDTVADVDAEAVATVLAGLRAGVLVEGLGPLPGLASVGLGHSAGAMVTVHLQARHGTHGALCLLGYSAHGLVSALSDEAKAYVGDTEGLRAALPGLVRNQWKTALWEMPRGGSTLLVAGEMADPVRAAIVACRTPLLALVGLSSMVPGSSADRLAAVDVPVFVGVGSLDIAGAAHTIPAAFEASHDVTLYVLEGSGHNHNVDPGRRLLWDRVVAWVRALDLGPHAAGTLRR